MFRVSRRLALATILQAYAGVSDDEVNEATIITMAAAQGTQRHGQALSGRSTSQLARRSATSCCRCSQENAKGDNNKAQRTSADT